MTYESASDELRSAMRIVEQRRARRREPQRIADVVSRLLARRGYAQVESVERLQKTWSGIVGVKLAEHSRPAGLKRGVLEIIVRSSVTLQELTFQKRQLLRELQRSESGEQVRDLRFRVAVLD